ncbi:MAG: hypothetical protein IKB54_02080, partial [Clostridia bacterium]|nr:hypothetical protein [Clostridia bacterium]
VDCGEALAGYDSSYRADEHGTPDGYQVLAYSRGELYVSGSAPEKGVYSIQYDDGILIFDKNFGNLKIYLLKAADLIREDEKEYFKEFDSNITGRTGASIEGCYYREIKLMYNTEEVTSIIDIETDHLSEDSALYLTINLGYVSGITETIVYASIDLLDTLHEIVCFDDEDDTTITRADDTSHLIAIEPIN